MRRTVVLGLILLALGLLGWTQGRLQFGSASAPRGAKRADPLIEKMAVVFAQHTFDPQEPPADMPPLGDGEEAECDSNFVSNAIVSGKLQRTDATHGMVTVTQVKMTLELKINTWVPVGATQHVIEHEEGHRRISEHYYENADQLAKQIADAYMGKQVAISGGDLDAELVNALRHLSIDITAEYNGRLKPNVAQQRYDDLTDHGRNTVAAEEAVAQVLQETER